MKSRGPASIAPIGAPSPLVKSIQSVSTSAANVAAGMLLATLAFISRAPSMCSGTPRDRAHAATAPSSSRVQTAPPPKLWVCSTQTSPTGWP